MAERTPEQGQVCAEASFVVWAEVVGGNFPQREAGVSLQHKGSPVLWALLIVIALVALFLAANFVSVWTGLF
jgi:hypothetical protein